MTDHSPLDGAADEPVNITMVTYNRAAFTRRSIESIAATAGFPYELTVVDNASRDETGPLLRDLHERGVIGRLILNDENRGVAYAANQGWVAGGKGRYMKIDNDIVFTKPDWLARIVEVCDALPDAGAVAYNFETTSYPLQEVAGQRVRPKLGNVGGCCVMIPERVHRLVGYWCEDYAPYSEEDSDMYVRLRQLGLRSYYMADEDVGLHLPEGKATPVLDRGRRTLFDEGDPAYRAQKDRWRTRYAGRRGLRRINQSLYATGLRPLYIEHGEPYRPSLLARAFVAARFLRLDRWEAPVPADA
ncbi:MAG TPA: glycosyltransferase [Candidatus Limnocylindrales bacterium]